MSPRWLLTARQARKPVCTPTCCQTPLRPLAHALPGASSPLVERLPDASVVPLTTAPMLVCRKCV